MTWLCCGCGRETPDPPASGPGLQRCKCGAFCWVSGTSLLGRGVNAGLRVTGMELTGAAGLGSATA